MNKVKLLAAIASLMVVACGSATQATTACASNETCKAETKTTPLCYFPNGEPTDLANLPDGGGPGVCVECLADKDCANGWLCDSGGKHVCHPPCNFTTCWDNSRVDCNHKCPPQPADLAGTGQLEDGGTQNPDLAGTLNNCVQVVLNCTANCGTQKCAEACANQVTPEYRDTFLRFIGCSWLDCGGSTQPCYEPVTPSELKQCLNCRVATAHMPNGCPMLGPACGF